MNMDRSAFIRAMRRVASSVSVVTTNGPSGRHGATVSAFCSVSADPPTALVCLNAQSQIARLVMANGSFNINILPQHARHIADRFVGAHDCAVSDRFDGIDIEPAEVPAISGATVLSCELDQSVCSGSHQVLIGKVIAASNGPGQPLTYLDGAYHQVSALTETAS